MVKAVLESTMPDWGEGGDSILGHAETIEYDSEMLAEIYNNFHYRV